MDQTQITGETSFSDGKLNKEASLADLLLMIFNHGDVKLGDLSACIRQHALDDLMLAGSSLEHDAGLAEDVARVIDRAPLAYFRRRNRKSDFRVKGLHRRTR